MEALIASTTTDDLTTRINLIIALVSLGGVVAAGLWNLRRVIRDDMKAITAASIKPVQEKQDEQGEKLDTLTNTVAVVVNEHQGLKERMAHIEGIEEGRRQAGAAVGIAANFLAQAQHPEEPRHESP